MNPVSKEQLLRLLEPEPGPCISIYLSSHRGGGAIDIKQDQIKLKNLLREARERLFANQFDDVEVDQIVDPLVTMLDDEAVWQQQSDGIAIFSTRQKLYFFRVPINFNGVDTVTVSDQFQIRPLLPLLFGDGIFFILALSQKDLRFYKGTRDQLVELPLPDGVPLSIDEALPTEEHQAQYHFNSGRQSSGSQQYGKQNMSGSADAVYHGDEPDKKNEIFRFFRRVDRGLHDLFQTQKAPLILVGVDYLLPIYRRANSYQQLLEQGIVGNSASFTLTELHQQALALVTPIFTASQQQALDKYQELAAKRLASADLTEIVSAAFAGRIDTLFIDTNCPPRWGRFDQAENRLISHDRQQPGDQDLLELAAVQTLLKGGQVYPLRPESMPDQSVIAASYRYMISSAARGGR